MRRGGLGEVRPRPPMCAGSLKFDRALSLRAGSSRPAGRPLSTRFRSDSTTTSSARGTTRGGIGTFARASPASRPPARDSPCSLQGARIARRLAGRHVTSRHVTSHRRACHVCEHPQRARDPWPEASTSAKSGSELTDFSRVPPGRAVVVEAERSRVERGRPRDRGPARSEGCGRTSNSPAHREGCGRTSNTPAHSEVCRETSTERRDRRSWHLFHAVARRRRSTTARQSPSKDGGISTRIFAQPSVSAERSAS